MKNFNRFPALALFALIVFSFSSCDEEDQTKNETIDFQSLELNNDGIWNGSDESGSKTFGVATFNNIYTADWDSWSGFAFSNNTDTATSGLTNQYSAYLKTGIDAENNYAVSYVFGESATIAFSRNVQPISAMISNSTYTYHSMLNGDLYSKKFEEGDWFLLTAKGYNEQNQEVGSVEFYLADFRTSPFFIIDTWTYVNLSALNEVKKIIFYLSSTDNGDWGMNTPAYFCLDDLKVKYEN